VLNGFIDALMGLHDLFRITNDAEAKALFDDGVTTLLSDGVLASYDLGYWTKYDQKPGCSMANKYNCVHVRQLRVLHKITGQELFDRTADKWAAYNLKHRHRICFLYHAAMAFLTNKHIRWRVLLPWRDTAQA
jgi:heparosan-N-sulfate-glucuronate 5-epimerase